VHLTLGHDLQLLATHTLLQARHVVDLSTMDDDALAHDDLFGD
jgi:hypothetical protein